MRPSSCEFCSVGGLPGAVMKAGGGFVSSAARRSSPGSGLQLERPSARPGLWYGSLVIKEQQPILPDMLRGQFRFGRLGQAAAEIQVTHRPIDCS